MKSNTYNFDAAIHQNQGHTKWHYVLLPKDIAKEIRQKLSTAQAKKSSTIAVEVSIELTRWHTKLFDEKKAETYLLPLKADPKSKFKVGDTIQISLTVLK